MNTANIITNNMNTAAAAATTKPKRPLSAYNLFYRFKRSKILTAHKSSGAETIIQLVESTPGLESYTPAQLSSMTSTQRASISRTEIRSELLSNLSPNETRKRTHRKSHGAMSFLEMNKAMVSSWKSINDETRGVFEELAEIGRRMYHKRMADYEAAVDTGSNNNGSDGVSQGPSKKMRISPSATAGAASGNFMMMTPQHHHPIFVPTLPPIMPPIMSMSSSQHQQQQQQCWTSVKVDEVDMFSSKNTATTTSYNNTQESWPFVSNNMAPSTPSYVANAGARRVSVQPEYDESMLWCVTTPMKFPEALPSTTTPHAAAVPKMKNKQEDAEMLLLNTVVGGYHPTKSSSTYSFNDVEEQPSTVSPMSNKSTMDVFDTLDLDEPLPAYFDDRSISSTTPSIQDGMMDFEPIMQDKKMKALAEEPTVDDFLKLIHQLDDVMPMSTMARCA